MTAPNASPSLQQLVLGDFEHELSITRRVLDRVPDDRFDWKPHEKSTSIGKLATHIAQVHGLLLGVLTSDVFDPTAGGEGMKPAPAASRDDVLRLFDDLTGKLRGAMAATSDEAWMRPWEFRRGGTPIMSFPSKAAALRTLGVSHLAHHRGQLSVYLRLLDIPVPSIYGPSADEPM